MTRTVIDRAERLVPPPSWAAQRDYRRKSELDGASGNVFIMDTATIIDDPFATVSMEWQTTVYPDGTTSGTLEAVKLSTGDDDAYIESQQLAHVVFVLCHAAVSAGIKL
ncbi:hypothetical protein HR12_23520 [Microbacterium sp. SUBG005]|nr:hypothetical protein HR12_23520 [Microbacterium sp. SUBG005]